MRKKFQALPRLRQHLYSLMLSVLCMAAAAGISSACVYAAPEYSPDIPLVFVLFLVLVSCCTAGYLYGILSSLFSVLWLRRLFSALQTSAAFPFGGYLVTFLFLAAISIFLSSLTRGSVRSAKAKAEREKLLAEAETEKIRSNLLLAISHDLRTPLTGIIGNSLTYLDNHATLTEQEKLTIITNIYDDSSWLINIVENLLSVTRIKNNDMTLSTSEESVEEVVGESLQKVEKRHPGSRIRARIPDDFIMLPMDAVLIEQVIINLLENALLHSGTKEPVEFIVEDYPECVSFTVRDYGNGLPDSVLEHLFDGANYTASRTVDGQKGMGIGLIICKTIIDAHQGTLTGHNHQSGAEFTFTLPKKKGIHE